MNGHTGKLRAVITPCSEGHYHAHFHATYWGVLPFDFEVPLTIHEDEGVATFEGQANLGRLAGGVFSYAGESNGCRFVSNYCASKDQGTFSMRRVCCE